MVFAALKMTAEVPETGATALGSYWEKYLDPLTLMKVTQQCIQ